VYGLPDLGPVYAIGTHRRLVMDWVCSVGDVMVAQAGLKDLLRRKSLSIVR
jgi:hypothetical protein